MDSVVNKQIAFGCTSVYNILTIVEKMLVYVMQREISYSEH